MHMIGQSDAHRVDFFVFQEILGIRIFAWDLKLGHEPLAALGNQISDGADLKSSGRQIALGVGRSWPAAADDPHADWFAHGTPLRCRSSWGCYTGASWKYKMT